MQLMAPPSSPAGSGGSEASSASCRALLLLLLRSASSEACVMHEHIQQEWFTMSSTSRTASQQARTCTSA